MKAWSPDGLPWWREPRFAAECDEWRRQQRIKNGQLVVDMPAGQIRKVRPLITAYAILWKEIE